MTDGVTEEPSLTLAQADMRLSKDGGAFAQKNASGNATHDSDGWYNTTLDATDTATVGELKLNVHQPANMLPVKETYWVLEEAIYDLLFGAAAVGWSTLIANAFADHFHRRTVANVEAASGPDTIGTNRSAYVALAKANNKVAIDGTDLKTYQDDDTTVVLTQALTTSASADPITAIDTT